MHSVQWLVFTHYKVAKFQWLPKRHCKREGIQRRFWKIQEYTMLGIVSCLKPKSFQLRLRKVGSSIKTFLVGFSEEPYSTKLQYAKFEGTRLKTVSVSDSALNKYVLRSWLILVEIGVQAKMKKKSFGWIDSKPDSNQIGKNRFFLFSFWDLNYYIMHALSRHWCCATFCHGCWNVPSFKNAFTSIVGLV